MLIDIYTHIFPGTFYEQMTKAAPTAGEYRQAYAGRCPGP